MTDCFVQGKGEATHGSVVSGHLTLRGALTSNNGIKA